MKMTKKIFAILLAVMMLAVCAAAWATESTTEDMSGNDGVIGAFDPADNKETQKTSVIIYKEITAYNPDTSTVNAPAVTYSYTVAAGSAGKAITDNSSHHDPAASVHATTKAGVGSPTITGFTLTPGTDTLSASQYGTANRFPVTVDFSGIFKTGTTANYSAGVYRYVITESTTETTKNASGIAEDDNAVKTLYMDVYVDGSGDIYGYTLFSTNDDIDATDSDAAAAAAVGKTEGFVGSKDDDEAYSSSDTQPVTDKYYTFNLSIKKIVENDNYAIEQKHQFPFTVTLDNATVTANVLPIMTNNNTESDTLVTQTALTAAAIGTGSNATEWSPAIAHNGVVTYTGIPCGTTVTISETNNLTGVTYKASISGADVNGEAKEIVGDATNGGVSNNATVSCNATALEAATENHTTGDKIVTFTNTLQTISPTGLVLRFAPYALILVGGIALLLIAMKHKKHADTDEE